MAAHPDPAESHPRSAGLAFVLGLSLGGLALFYVMPPRRALLPAALSYLIVAVSGGTLWLPVFFGIAFWAARRAKYSETGLAYSGRPDLPGAVADIPADSDPVPPSAYLRLRSR